MNQSNYFLKIWVTKLVGNAKNAGNQGGGVETKFGNICTAVEIT